MRIRCLIIPSEGNTQQTTLTDKYQTEELCLCSMITCDFWSVQHDKYNVDVRQKYLISSCILASSHNKFLFVVHNRTEKQETNIIIAQCVLINQSHIIHYFCK